MEAGSPGSPAQVLFPYSLHSVHSWRLTGSTWVGSCPFSQQAQGKVTCRWCWWCPEWLQYRWEPSARPRIWLYRVTQGGWRPPGNDHLPCGTRSPPCLCLSERYSWPHWLFQHHLWHSLQHGWFLFLIPSHPAFPEEQNFLCPEGLQTHCSCRRTDFLPPQASPFKRSPIHIYSSKLWPSKVFFHQGR